MWPLTRPASEFQLTWSPTSYGGFFRDEPTLELRLAPEVCRIACLPRNRTRPFRADRNRYGMRRDARQQRPKMVAADRFHWRPGKRAFDPALIRFGQAGSEQEDRR